MIAASVWIAPVIVKLFGAVMLRPTALTMPAVVVSGRLNGLPIATTGSPTWAVEESANAIGCSSEAGTSTWITATSVRRVGAEHLGAAVLPVLEVDPDRGRAGDDVLVGEDVALGVVHDAGALARGLLLAATAAEEAAAAALLGRRVMSTTPGLAAR